MAKRKQQKKDMTVAESKEMQRLVDETLKETHKYQDMIQNAESEEEMRLRIKQIYFNNLKAAGEPLALSQKIMADLLTRMEVDRINGNDQTPLDERYFKLLDEMRKTLKVVKEMEGKTVVQHNVQTLNDESLKVTDAEVVEAMFKDDAY